MQHPLDMVCKVCA